MYVLEVDQIWQATATSRTVTRRITGFYQNKQNVKTVVYMNTNDKECKESYEDFSGWIESRKAKLVGTIDTPLLDTPESNVEPAREPGTNQADRPFHYIQYQERVSVYIDGQNFYNFAKNLNLQFDYKKFRSYLENSTNLVRCHYYTGVTPSGNYNSIMPLLDWLEYNGYALHTREGDKLNIDSDLIVDVMNHAYRNRLDHIILFSGDSDYTKMVASVQELGIKVTVVASTRIAGCSDVIRRQCDYFVELDGLREFFSK